ncbi:MAG: PIG-L family deacetylase [Cytophagales bacterium]|nr:PIG-L family deacetylase [Cytophagales bacterium]
MTKTFYPALLMLVMSFFSFAQPKQFSSSDIQQKLKKLGVLGSVLYVAAHPDDENTSLIGYYANEELYRTAYLSATRGDGGQNLIGPEIREQLGIIRTQELLAARRNDGSQQFFSRANDFGYSKHPDETFNVWGHDEILADFVWSIRKFRPDVIMTRFNIAPGMTHGHHTASAMLAKEAFKLSGDKNAFPEQLEFVDVWQPKRLYWNTSPWFYRRSGETLDTTGLAKINIGKYNPVLGKSYSEISAISRSMHKSQGFGSTGRRGDSWEYLIQWDGDESSDPFADVETSWKRVTGGESIGNLVNEATMNYDPNDPNLTLGYLMRIKDKITAMDDDFWREIKLAEVDELILAITGTYLEVRANDYAFVPGDSIELTLEVINRSSSLIFLENIEFSDFGNQSLGSVRLDLNTRFNEEFNFKLPENLNYSQHYWLEEEGVLGRYKVANQQLRGNPENAPVLSALINLSFRGQNLPIEVPIIFKRNDPVDGEVYRPIEIQPAVMANIESASLIFSDAEAKPVEVRVIAGKDNVKGNLGLNLPDGWKSAPESQNVELVIKGEEQVFTFEITPPAGASEGLLEALMTVDGKSYDRGRVVIEYDHIPTQTLFPKSGTRVVKLDLKKKGNSIGYIEGAGDDLPNNLTQIGYTVTMLEKDDVSATNLAQFDAVILGVRAFNTVSWLAYKNQDLFEYVKNGGNVIVQFNTSHRLVTQEVAPFPLKLSRDRVAVEEAEVRIIAENHDVLNTPNKITSEDFDNWVQERGLYFPNEWSDDFAAILSSNDPGEDRRDGGLLVAKYGEGYYVYSGYSWFRQLPAGVPGAYRLFTNLISLGK